MQALELAGNAASARDNKKTHIMHRHIQLAVRNGGAIYLMLVVGNTRQTGALEQVRPCRTLFIYLFHEFLFIYS